MAIKAIGLIPASCRCDKANVIDTHHFWKACLSQMSILEHHERCARVERSNRPGMELVRYRPEGMARGDGYSR